jgi:hypothetical protein
MSALSTTTPLVVLGLSTVEVYYDGLKTKHSFLVCPINNFLYLKFLLSHKDNANIPVENQKLIYCGLVPYDTDTMAMHNVGTGGFRIALVRVKSPAEIAKQEEEGRMKEEGTHGYYIKEKREALGRTLAEHGIDGIERAEEAMFYRAIEESTRMM